MRVGIGYDIHRLVENRKLFLGGVNIPHEKGLLGHSDGDVVMHAVADAMLGAMALGDIGIHFPNTDPKYKDISSGELLGEVLALAKERNFIVNNVDTMIIAEEPKIYPFREKMVEALSKALNITKEKVNIKATTNEGVGSIGKGEAIAAYAVVTLRREEVNI
jgi:2-C-methyl-D-erythritol 2,4-cyclodiphosphate synthase